MKNKAPLALMEQLIMLVVFALAAAVCLRVFVLSDRMSEQCSDRDYSVVAVQNAAETLKLCSGDLQACAALGGGTAHEDVWEIGYDARWEQVATQEAEYLLSAVLRQEQPMLGSARVSVATAQGEQLFALQVCWQEGDHG